MKALVLEKIGELTLRDIGVSEKLGNYDVKIAPKACGICGSDVHYYKEGRIGDFVVTKPMILGHEASGVILEVGSKVKKFKIGDRVCMEPGIPNFQSRETLEGNYNLDPEVAFWATPPIHGVMRETVIHPESLTFKLPTNVSFHDGAMIEPLAVGIEAAKVAKIEPGDVALVVGSGTIGIMTALSVLAGGCSKVLISDVSDDKLKIAKTYDGIHIINTSKDDLKKFVLDNTNGKGVDILLEASGNVSIFPDIVRNCKSGGRVVLIGMPNKLISLNIPVIQVLGLSFFTIFRYRNCFERALELVSSQKIDLKRLISKVFKFEDSINAYKYAAEGRSDTIKVMIDF